MKTIALVVVSLVVCGCIVVKQLAFSISRCTVVASDDGFLSPVLSLRDENKLIIRPGELPGYTGWARPEYTMAPYYQIEQIDYEILAGSRWRAHINCPHKACLDARAHFHVRLYGPAVLSGLVHDYRNGSYSIHAWPIDPGLYTVEVVLAFSDAPEWKVFPLPIEKDEPAYEGYMIPGFPCQLQVFESIKQIHNSSTGICTLEDLVTTGASEGPRSGPRWVVADKVGSRNHIQAQKGRTKSLSLKGYQSGANSLGIFMEYRPRACSLLSLPLGELRNPNGCLVATKEQPLHFIFVGDSVTRLQKEVFENLVGPSDLVQVTHISIKTGLTLVLSNVTERLTAMMQTAPTNERRFLFFNSGLHDIHRLCTQKWRKARHKYISESDKDFSCARAYRSDLKRFLEFMANYPAELRVFQTTSAGKFGMMFFSVKQLCVCYLILTCDDYLQAGRSMETMAFHGQQMKHNHFHILLIFVIT